MFKSCSKAFLISTQRLVRYLKVGLLLHLISIVSVVLCFLFAKQASSYREDPVSLFFIVHTCLSLYSLVLVFFAQKDAFCRFQNYKRAKDLFFENGFKKRIVNIFIRSRCQRDAIKIAANDLGMIKELNRYYTDMGYRWYHLIPDIVFTEPARLSCSRFWKNTLFTPSYQSKYFLW